MGTTTNRRDDIDGLRAVAVLCVLFYHFTLGPFPGGYLGVDIFFVISGFVITSLITRDIAAGTFSFAKFYDRRIRRIVPGMVVVLVASSAAAYLWLLPDELTAFSKQLLAASTFSSNLLDWRWSHAYASPDSATNPLLHFWSLAVEGQFYLLWPILLVFIRKGAHSAILVSGLVLVSFALNFLMTETDPIGAFYLPHARAWELLSGAALALVADRKDREIPTASYAAVMLIGIPILTDWFTPPWGGVLVCTGAVLFMGPGKGSRINALIASRPFTFVGRMSYSLYLWHWPLLVFGRLLANRPLTIAESALLLGMTTALASLSWYHIEEPIRRMPLRIWRVPASYLWGGGASFLLIVASIAVIVGGGLSYRMPPDIRAFLAEAEYRPTVCHAMRGSSDIPPAEKCLFNVAGPNGEAVLWGDSHAEAVLPAALDFAQSRGLSLRHMTRSACPPLRPGSTTSKISGLNPACLHFNQKVWDYIRSNARVKTVIMGAYWRGHLAGLSGENGRLLSETEAQAELALPLQRTTEDLSEGGKRVLIFGPVPEFHQFPAHCLGRSMLLKLTNDGCASSPRNEVDESTRMATSIIKEAAVANKSIATFFPIDTLCDNKKCYAVKDGRLLFRDDTHLTPFAARLLGAALVASTPP